MLTFLFLDKKKSWTNLLQLFDVVLSTFEQTLVASSRTFPFLKKEEIA